MNIFFYASLYSGQYFLVIQRLLIERKIKTIHNIAYSAYLSFRLRLTKTTENFVNYASI